METENKPQVVEVSTSGLSADQVKGLAPEIAAVNNTPATPKPSQGRIVIYSHPGARGGGAPYSCAAIVTGVAEDGSVSLYTFPARTAPEQPTGVIQGDGPGQWSWPARS